MPENDITTDELYDFLVELYRPPKKGSTRMLMYGGYWWKWKAGVDGSMQVSDDCETWRTPGEKERGVIRKFSAQFNINK